MTTLYAKRVPPAFDKFTDDILRGLFGDENYDKGRTDVAVFRDQECTVPFNYYHWTESSKPTRRNRYIMHNCARYRLVWLEDAF